MIASEPSEIEGPPPSLKSDPSCIDIPISYDEESDSEGYNYCRTEGDCRPEMSYLDSESDESDHAIAKSFELNALDIVRQMYRTPSETSDSRTVTEKSEC